jgi:hypothetical protein
MIWFAKRDRDLAAFAEAIQPELEMLRTPPATHELYERIVAGRRAGARVILPVERIPFRSRSRYVIAAVLVIAALLALPVYRLSRDEVRDAGPATQFSYFGGVARAEGAPTDQHLPPALAIRPERVRERTLQYLRVWQDPAGRVTKKVNSVLSVTADGSSWRVVSTGREVTAAGQAMAAETLLVAQRDLHLQHRVVHVRPYRRWKGINIEQLLSADSVNGRMTLDDVKGMRPIARRLPSAYGPYLADVMAPLYFASVPLSPSWSGRLTVLGWAVVPNDVLLPVELRVIGEERVEVPAGSFDCWKLEVRYAGGAFDYWVRKADGIAVRTLEQQRDGARRSMTLEHEGSI